MSARLQSMAVGCAVFLLGALPVALAAFLFQSTLAAPQREQLAAMAEQAAQVAALLAFLLAFVAVAVARWFVARYLTPAHALAEELDVVLSSNPAHRPQPPESGPLQAVVERINRLADVCQAREQEVEARVREARADLEEERNRLAALMSELTQSVVVCNIEGRILLYNARARQLLEADPGTGALVGLGRSVFGIIDRELVVHALDNLHFRRQQGEGSVVSQFVTSSKQGDMIRVQMAPVYDAGGAITGFVLTCEDITHAVAAGHRQEALLQGLMEQTRAALGSIRAAIENILNYPDMAAERRARFSAMIRDEAQSLSGRLDTTMAEFSEHAKTQWPLEEMRGTDLAAVVQRRIGERVGIATKLEGIDAGLWLKVESFTLAQGLTFLAERLHLDFGVREVRFRLSAAGRMAHLDLMWRAIPLSVETVSAWQDEPLRVGGESSALSLRDIADRHGGDLWYQVDRTAHVAYFRLLLPITEPAARWSVPVSQGSRPEYYDFDLFNQPGQTRELDERRLADLTYTVFDTETTGLDPSTGDEIISIGAMRVVNGRALYSEVFEQLVDPRRGMSRESIAIHGITPEMLEGQPTIDIVLPQFYRFAEDTVLVAHNAAFDMRFLQLKEERTGIRFINPVLDTLLLSAVIHPNLNSHRLEAIAERLGVNVIGRHTALGDAIVTGEVFLKMVPLLAEKGIHTLRQAREAAQKTYYARIDY